MDFYTNPLSPNCRKVDAVARQLDIALNRKVIDVAKAGQSTGCGIGVSIGLRQRRWSRQWLSSLVG